ncbi:MAG: ABC transporter permease subunit [Promethearchaeia archaeon]
MGIVSFLGEKLKFLKIAWKELKYSFKRLTLTAVLIALLMFWYETIFDPDLFGEFSDILENYPEGLQQMVGGQLILTEFGGFMNIYVFTLSWLYFGIYIIIRSSQDIPREIEQKTIDVTLSKPIKRWEFFIGKYLYQVFAAGYITVIVAVTVILNTFWLPNIDPADVYYDELILAFFWLFLFLVSLISTSMLFASFSETKRALALSMGVFVFFYAIGTYYESFGDEVDFLKYFSPFYYFQTSDLLVDHIWEDVWWNMLVLAGYSLIILVISIIIFNKRDIPV